MITMNIKDGAELATTITIYIEEFPYTRLRSLHEITESEMTDYLKSVFSGCFTNHFGESESVLGDGRFVERENEVRIEIEIEWVDGIVNFYTISEIEESIKKAREVAAMNKAASWDLPYGNSIIYYLASQGILPEINKGNLSTDK